MFSIFLSLCLMCCGYTRDFSFCAIILIISAHSALVFNLCFTHFYYSALFCTSSLYVLFKYFLYLIFAYLVLLMISSLQVLFFFFNAFMKPLVIHSFPSFVLLSGSVYQKCFQIFSRISHMLHLQSLFHISFPNFFCQILLYLQ